MAMVRVRVTTRDNIRTSFRVRVRTRFLKTKMIDEDDKNNQC